MPQLDPTFYPTQLFWLVVIFTLLFLVVWKVALPRIADIRDTRRTRIDTDLEKAGKLKEEAEDVLAAYERSLAEATAKAQGVHRSVADELLAERNRRLDEVSQSMAARLREAEAGIAAEEKRAAKEISTVSAELVQLATEQLGTGKTTKKDASAAVKAALEGAS